MSNPDGDRPYSIDLTLELERQLDSESLPPPTPQDANRPQSLDHQVLAHIVTDLRASLTEATRQRDELAKALFELQARERDFTDTLSYMTDKCSKLQEELDLANNKARDDENTISMLRSKVDESRRGLMRLQSESRRHSQVPSGLDLSRASLVSLSGPQTSKRASFAPNATRINAHRRISSVSDSGFTRFENGSPHGSPGPANLTFTDTMLANKSASLRPASPPPHVSQSEDIVEVEMLRKEVSIAQTELEETKHELNEANEAREASELCVKALRTFIEENNVGAPVSNGRGPAVALASSQVESKKTTQSTGGWGFKLWRTESLAKNPPGAMSIPIIPPTTIPNNASSSPPQPLSRKLGDFFGARSGSISSITPVKSPRAEQEPIYNGLSDTSSIEESLPEPASPVSELPRPSVLVRDTMSVTSVSSTRDLGASPELKTGGLPSPSEMEGSFTPVAI